MRYIIQEGTDYAPIYWNSLFETSQTLNKKFISKGFCNKNQALEIKELWEKYGNYKCSFSLIEVKS